jgi:hypothetical protein
MFFPKDKIGVIFIVLECNAIYSGESRLMFWRNVLRASSWLKRKLSSAYFLLYVSFLLGLIFDPENGGEIFVLVVYLSSDHTATYFGRGNFKKIISS